ncbi:hypothetical protein [Crocosphaera sp. XPORK-15E]|uniref:hypothetical protein n=1 Tax=Crocosphaera sp. XPORK-15E TaxID=3110247 RepID=UPI002B204C7E|nr:hypothetical protein [Crocosphaera sp. XPORK-15E]MEA5532663.1 hypothetical protein [Crocosphaera sp. XPORK-15E]
MKSLIISTASILLISLISAVPALAQSERITCLRDQNVINCPGYGSFNYRFNNNNGNVNRTRNDSELNKEIDNVYLQVLGYNADYNGLRNYNQAINNKGWSLAQVRTDLARSPAFDQAMNAIYQEFLGRNADNSGLQSYRTLIINGRNIDDVKTEIANSPEARNVNNYNRDFYRRGNNNSFGEDMNDIFCQTTGICF